MVFLDTINPLCSRNWIVEGNIRKIAILPRIWRDIRIVQGIQVFLENGETQAFGMDLNDIRALTLSVPEGQHIKDFVIKSGWYIDAIAIETSGGETTCSIGGLGGEFMDSIEIAPLAKGTRVFKYIDGIKGKIVSSEDGPCICELAFKYVFVPIDI